MTETNAPAAVEISRRSDHVLITVRGNLNRVVAADLRNVLFDPTICDRPTILVDLHHVTSIGSVAIGGLIAARRWHQARDTAMSLLVEPTGVTGELFATPPLSVIFDVRPPTPTGVAPLVPVPRRDSRS